MSSRTLRTMQSLGRQSSLAELHGEAQNSGGFIGYLTTTVTDFFTSPHSACIKFAVVMAGIALTLPAILFPVFVSLKIEGHVHWTWLQTFIPLFIVTVVLLPVYMLLTQIDNPKVGNNDDDGPPVSNANTDCHANDTAVLLAASDAENPPQKIMTWGSVFTLLCSLVAHIFIALRLDGHLDWAWLYVLLPYCFVILVDRSSSSVLQVLQVVFVAEKLDGALTWSWLVVLLPTWLPLAVMLIVFPIGAAFAVLMFAGDDDSPSSPTPWCFATSVFLGVFSFFALVTGPQLLIVLRLQYLTFSTMWICVPWIIMYSVVVVLATLAVLILAFHGKPTASLQENTLTSDYGSV
ncbi:hypothetical protein SPRG_16776 [Saprolegnia parasitica CBS 223.65]|uniref:Transmembrane protein n=1 Tax=Saprolegnia parasitica (strain CBS 223.65) TaxID=695850 RepID=A0A067BHG0_SAPPC|nr:hypothetical protein SPRG_16776 [Saprolegnia parasitica CBS 223.65]KDO17819.1 hypothetical protein SPRG_16776 [Saprolegnia parasitica CBS 223.65]|eukprot:XP_012211475.1 hypothetical protein SPRG_16776 [Saprolegnia parasitica CBS 223.65]